MRYGTGRCEPKRKDGTNFERYAKEETKRGLKRMKKDVVKHLKYWLLSCDKDVASRWLQYLDLDSLHSLMTSCSDFFKILSLDNNLWRFHTRIFLQGRKRWRLSEEQEKERERKRGFRSWMEEFKRIQGDLRFKELSYEHLTRCRWFFNFSTSAGSCGVATIQEVVFSENGFMYMTAGYPPMPYSLLSQEETNRTESMYSQEVHSLLASLFQTEGQTLERRTLQNLSNAGTMSEEDEKAQEGKRSTCVNQYVRIADFPPHLVSWRKDAGEWVIKNRNVVIWSVADDENIRQPCYLPPECAMAM